MNYSNLGHLEDFCWKKPKLHFGATNFLEILLDYEEATLQQLNIFCGGENVLSYILVPKRKVPMEVTLNTMTQNLETNNGGVGLGKSRDVKMNREMYVKFKILSHFNKGKLSLFLNGNDFMTPIMFEHLESLVKLAIRRKDVESKDNYIYLVSTPTITQKNCINKTHRSKALHLLVEVNNYVVERLMDISASISIMLVVEVKELGIMHTIIKFETYKIASSDVHKPWGGSMKSLSRFEMYNVI